MFKSIFTIFIVTITSLYSSTSSRLSAVETLKILAEIEQFAIVVGNGKRKVHSFIDPKCSVSRRYVKHIFSHSRKMFKRYTIYLFPYELKRLNSKQVIQNIFDSDYPVAFIKSFMVKRERVELEDIDDEDIDEKIYQISQVAEAIGVYKRPYIIMNGRGK
jgi:hypothetical protein